MCSISNFIESSSNVLKLYPNYDNVCPIFGFKLPIVRVCKLKFFLRALGSAALLVSAACFAQGPFDSSSLPDAPLVQLASSAQQAASSPEQTSSPAQDPDSAPGPKSEKDKKKELQEQAQKELKEEEQQ